MPNTTVRRHQEDKENATAAVPRKSFGNGPKTPLKPTLARNAGTSTPKPGKAFHANTTPKAQRSALRNITNQTPKTERFKEEKNADALPATPKRPLEDAEPAEPSKLFKLAKGDDTKSAESVVENIEYMAPRAEALPWDPGFEIDHSLFIDPPSVIAYEYTQLLELEEEAEAKEREAGITSLDVKVSDKNILEEPLESPELTLASKKSDLSWNESDDPLDLSAADDKIELPFDNFAFEV
ncbi:hypothetical protein BZG36_04812 [Bifiguratus adelaidae]|uniref:Securin n=1 Tax=Bifiguratus adelaidae TaxID=1938954 RepID=A0A261XTZ0_9FUNG|nr:hypothetical protein BZG36_04812 [Bifiguratus adelaidae]